jgi:uncharacterized protein (TIGR03086 family)
MAAVARRRDRFDMAPDPCVADDLGQRLDLLERADGGFARCLNTVTETDWHRPTPCTEWDVTALVNHVIGANRRYVLLLHGASAEEVEGTRTIDHVGSDPLASFAATAAQVVASFREPGATTRVVPHRNGHRTGAELLSMRIVDVAVHTWDLARAVGVDARIEPAVVDAALAALAGVDLAQNAFAAAPDGGGDTTPLERLLLRTGRDPDWRRENR